MIVDRPQAAFVCIGDEILSGCTQDTNLAFLGNWLNAHGMNLAEARVIADTTEAIVQAVNQLRERYAYVFTSGGIGATHDDITAESLAVAFKCKLIEDARALHILERNYAGKGGLNAARRLMARMPEGASLIYGENIGAPGFQMENVYVMAGVPAIFRAMLNTLAPQFDGKQVWHSCTLEVLCGETTIALELKNVQQKNFGVKIGSYPQFDQQRGYYTQLVFRGPSISDIEVAIDQTETFLQRLGVEVRHLGDTSNLI